jgi:hypothetical protein
MPNTDNVNEFVNNRDIERFRSIYPATPVTDDSIIYPDDVIDSLKFFKKYCRSKLQTPAQRLESMQNLIAVFNNTYAMPSVTVVHTNPEVNTSTASNANVHTRTITMIGKLSIITLLHEFAHILNPQGGEDYAVKWSLTLFKKVYPLAFENLVPQGHLLVEAVPAAATVLPIPAMTENPLGVNE